MVDSISSEQVGTVCISASQSLENENTLFVLGGDKFAHMTVYMARFADIDIDNIVRVEKAMHDASSFKCEHTGYFMTEGRYLEASYLRSPELMKLHETLIASVADCRINPGNPFEEGYFTPYTPEQKKNAEETGYDLVRNLYRPHITLTRYKEGRVPDTIPDFPKVGMSFELSKVCVYKADDNGAVYELIKEFHI